MERTLLKLAAALVAFGTLPRLYYAAAALL